MGSNSSCHRDGAFPNLGAVPFWGFLGDIEGLYKGYRDNVKSYCLGFRVSQNLGVPFLWEVPHNQDYSIRGSVLGSPF